MKNATESAGSMSGYKMAEDSYKANHEMGSAYPMGVKGGPKGRGKGDASPRAADSSGGNLAEGVSHRMAITETPEQLGQGRDMYSGKPDGPEKRGIKDGQKFA